MRPVAAAVIVGVLLCGCAATTQSQTQSSRAEPARTTDVTQSAGPSAATPEVSASPPPSQLTRDECAQIWYDYQYASLAPDFPVATSLDEVESLHASCQEVGLLPTYDEQLVLTQQAFSTTAQILERQIAKVSKKTGKAPCEAIFDVLKPVGPNGRALGPGDDVEGYAADSFLPILRYNWLGGPFRLKFGVGCNEYPYANLWFFAEPYPPEGDHPDRYPSDAEVTSDPWPREPFQGPMSTCITWGPELGNDVVGSRGLIFSFNWDRANLPLDVRSCYPKALGLEGLDQFPFEVVPNLK